MVAIMRPFGEVVVPPFEVNHTDSDLRALIKQLNEIQDEIRVAMEPTANYYVPVAVALNNAGFFVSVVNAKLVHDYGTNNLRTVKTDKKDAIKLANYALNYWRTLRKYVPEDDTRLMLKLCYRQYVESTKVQTMLKNNLISLLDIVFPDINRMFRTKPREDGSEKWIDFVSSFWHRDCICEYSETDFVEEYRSWCKQFGYRYTKSKAAEIHAFACGQIGILPRTESIHHLMEQTLIQLRASCASVAYLKKEMQTLAALLPEYPIVMNMYGIGSILGPQLMAEIGDVRRFHSKKALVAYAGLDAPPFESGNMQKRRRITKRGSPTLRRTLFLVMSIYLQSAPADDPVYQFMEKKRAEGKPYKVYMVASANKFLRRYYATVTAYLNGLEEV